MAKGLLLGFVPLLADGGRFGGIDIFRIFVPDLLRLVPVSASSNLVKQLFGRELDARCDSHIYLRVSQPIHISLLPL